MKITITPSDIIAILAICLLLGPWLYFDKPGWGSYVLTCIGAVLAGISKADSISDMLGRGRAGDVFLRDYWLKLKAWIFKKN